MRLKDRKEIWIKKLNDMTPFHVAGELAKLERELERKNEDVGFVSRYMQGQKKIGDVTIIGSLVR